MTIKSTLSFFSSLMIGREGTYNFFSIPVKIESYCDFSWKEKLMPTFFREYLASFIHELAHSCSMRYFYGEYGTIQLWTTGGGRTTPKLFGENILKGYRGALISFSGPFAECLYRLIEVFIIKSVRNHIHIRFKEKKHTLMAIDMLIKAVCFHIVLDRTSMLFEMTCSLCAREYLLKTHSNNDFLKIYQNVGIIGSLASAIAISIPVFLSFKMMIRSRSIIDTEKINTHTAYRKA
jgi:hypothetical protein